MQFAKWKQMIYERAAPVGGALHRPCWLGDGWTGRCGRGIRLMTTYKSCPMLLPLSFELGLGCHIGFFLIFFLKHSSDSNHHNYSQLHLVYYTKYHI